MERETNFDVFESVITREVARVFELPPEVLVRPVVVKKTMALGPTSEFWSGDLARSYCTGRLFPTRLADAISLELKGRRLPYLGLGAHNRGESFLARPWDLVRA